MSCLRWDSNPRLLASQACYSVYDVVLGTDDPDELEVYGTDTTTGPMLTSYKFEVTTVNYIIPIVVYSACTVNILYLMIDIFLVVGV